jgi:hypothetical protein
MPKRPSLSAPLGLGPRKATAHRNSYNQHGATHYHHRAVSSPLLTLRTTAHHARPAGHDG